MATVSFKDATRVYPGADHPSVDRLNLDIDDGEFMVGRTIRLRQVHLAPHARGPGGDQRRSHLDR